MLNMTHLVGVYFGYPECCIKAYDKVLASGGRRTPEQANPKVHKGTGFIPCPNHAKQILEGEITLESLINDRRCALPFPNEPEIEVIDEFLTNPSIKLSI